MQSPSNAQREQLMTVPVSVSVSDLEANPGTRRLSGHPLGRRPRRLLRVGSFQFRSAEQFADAPRRAEHAAQRGREPSAGQRAVPPAFRQPPASLDDAGTHVSAGLPTNGVVDLLACGVEPLVSPALVHLLGLELEPDPRHGVASIVGFPTAKNARAPPRRPAIVSEPVRRPAVEIVHWDDAWSVMAVRRGCGR